MMPLDALGSGATGGFMFYIAIVQWVVLNVVTGAFCESAAQAARKDVVLAMQEYRVHKEQFVEKSRIIFSSIDEEGTGVLHVHEMKPFMDSEPARALFGALDLDVGDVEELFAILDDTGTETIDIEQFVTGILRLRGGATALDVAKLQHQNLAMRRVLDASMAELRELLRLNGISVNVNKCSTKPPHKAKRESSKSSCK